jgi:hypothetical protein
MDWLIRAVVSRLVLREERCHAACKEIARAHPSIEC